MKKIFKIGDKVKCIENRDNKISPGDIGIVMTIMSNNFYNVKWNNKYNLCDHMKTGNKNCWSIKNTQISLYKPNNQYEIY